MATTHPFPRKPARAGAVQDSRFPSRASGQRPIPGRRGHVEVTHAAASFSVVDNYLQPPRVFFPILFFRIAACTCSALTMTTSSMPPWREVLQGGWLWRDLRPRSGGVTRAPWPGAVCEGLVFVVCSKVFILLSWYLQSLDYSTQIMSSFSLALLIFD